MLHAKTSALTLLALFTLVASGCGGGAAAADQEVKIPDWIKNNADWWADGMISDEDFSPATGRGGHALEDATGIYVGTAPGAPRLMRGYLRFDLSALAGKTILSAELQLTQTHHSDLPWTFGGLTLTRIDMHEARGSAEPHATVIEHIVTHTTPLGDGETVSWDVTPAVTADLAEDQLADFRLAFPDNMPAGVYARFGGAGGDAAPRLIIEYQQH